MDKDESNLLFLGFVFRVQFVLRKGKERKGTGKTSNQIAAERIRLTWHGRVCEYVSCDISGIK